jgi:hypothetical protein
MEAKHDTAGKVINGRINGRFAPGYSGCPGGSPEATRRAFNKRFLLDLAEDWQQHGREVFKRVRRESPAAYLKVCAMMVPKEMKADHSASAIKQLTDAQLEAMIEHLNASLEAKAQGAKLIEGIAKPAAPPAPEAQSIGAALEPKRQRRPNRLLMQADTAGARERKPRKRDAKPVPPPSRL